MYNTASPHIHRYLSGLTVISRSTSYLHQCPIQHPPSPPPQYLTGLTVSSISIYHHLHQCPIQHPPSPPQYLAGLTVSSRSTSHHLHQCMMQHPHKTAGTAVSAHGSLGILVLLCQSCKFQSIDLCHLKIHAVTFNINIQILFDNSIYHLK